MGKEVTYKTAGVDIDKGNKFVSLIKPLVRSTFRPEVLSDIGGFGGLFQLPAERFKKPVLVSSTDGVGTKLKIAFMTGNHATIGIDLVAMCVNDILVQGAEPLFFLDYFATASLSPEKAADVVEGIAAGCKEAGCALIGGETAEMPGFYHEDEYDLSGFSVGIVDKDKLVNGARIREGDVIIGLSSSGLHSNGYSLARKVLFDIMGLDISHLPDGAEKTIGEILLEPTKIYVKPVLQLLNEFDIKGMAHITGGGLIENIPRILPPGLNASITKGSWKSPAIFRIIREGGSIDEHEMYRVFNNGIGFILVINSRDADKVVCRLKEYGEEAAVIGAIEATAGDESGSVTLNV